jgi:hypothetical protein
VEGVAKETERAKARKVIILGKFESYLTYKDKRTGKKSSERVAESLREIRIESLTGDSLKTYLYGIFGAICYDITALSEIRGIPLRKTGELWSEFQREKGKLIEDWIVEAKGHLGYGRKGDKCAKCGKGTYYSTGKEVEKLAKRIRDEYLNTSPPHRSKVVLPACYYLAYIAKGMWKTQEEVSLIYGVSTTTIREVYKDIIRR